MSLLTFSQRASIALAISNTRQVNTFEPIELAIREHFPEVKLGIDVTSTQMKRFMTSAFDANAPRIEFREITLEFIEANLPQFAMMNDDGTVMTQEQKLKVLPALLATQRAELVSQIETLWTKPLSEDGVDALVLNTRLNRLALTSYTINHALEAGSKDHEPVLSRIPLIIVETIGDMEDPNALKAFFEQFRQNLLGVVDGKPWLRYNGHYRTENAISAFITAMEELAMRTKLLTLSDAE